MAEALQSPIVSDDSINPRVEIDTSQPFGSVKEAVTRFGGSGSWIPLHILRLAGHDLEEIDMETIEKQAAELEKELNLKQQETLEVLRELESAKGIMEGLKLNIMKQVSSILNLNPDSGTVTPVDKSTATLTLCPVPMPPGIMLSELKEAKLKLNRTTNDLAMIRASVESLNKKMRTHEMNLAETGETKSVIEQSVDDSNNGSHKLTFEAQQLRSMEEAAQYEVIKATSEIEHTKMSIKMVEMRLIAAKKMEEAARAMEAVAYAENNKALALEGVTLSYEEYYGLAPNAKRTEDISKKNDYHRKDVNLSTMAFLKNSIDRTDDVKFSRMTLEEALGPKTDAAKRRNLESKNGLSQGKLGNHNHPKTRNSNPFSGHAPRRFEPLIGDYSDMINKESRPVLRTSVSIGDILSRKLILQDNITVREDVESQTRRDDASLSGMLREQSGLIFHDSVKTDKEDRMDKQFFTQRKKFGFIHVSLPLTKHKKKKSNPQPPHPLNMRYS